MLITIEKIEELRKRTSVSYNEAKMLLEKHDGDVLEAIIELEKNKKLNSNNHFNYSYNYEYNNNNCYKQKSEHAAKLKNLWVKGNQSKFIVTKKGETILKIPVNYLIVSLILGFHLAMLSFILILATGCKMSIQKSTGSMMDVDDAIIDMAEKVKNNASEYIKENHDSNYSSNVGNNTTNTANNTNPTNNTNNSNSSVYI